MGETPRRMALGRPRRRGLTRAGASQTQRPASRRHASTSVEAPSPVFIPPMKEGKPTFGNAQGLSGPEDVDSAGVKASNLLRLGNRDSFDHCLKESSTPGYIPFLPSLLDRLSSRGNFGQNRGPRAPGQLPAAILNPTLKGLLCREEAPAVDDSLDVVVVRQLLKAGFVLAEHLEQLTVPLALRGCP